MEKSTNLTASYLPDQKRMIIHLNLNEKNESALGQAISKLFNNSLGQEILTSFNKDILKGSFNGLSYYINETDLFEYGHVDIHFTALSAD
jgi:hypothetical protein